MVRLPFALTPEGTETQSVAELERPKPAPGASFVLSDTSFHRLSLTLCRAWGGQGVKKVLDKIWGAPYATASMSSPTSPDMLRLGLSVT